MSYSRFVDKVVIVTGAGSGLGESAALSFAAEGAKVIVSDISEAQGQAVAEAIRAQGAEAHFVRADVASEEEVKSLFDETVKQYGKVDVIFANAGINIEANVDELSTRRLEKSH